jgi:mono/diheme cytochrome c family protein
MVLRFLSFLGLVAVACTGSVQAQTRAGDAWRGEQLLCDLGCTTCHKLDEHKGATAPDLGRRISRSYTPALLTAVIWNHASHRESGAGPVHLSADQTADLLSYFASRRYFEPPGDAARGRQVFIAKHCSGCHGVTRRLSAEANPVVEWRSLRDPIAFAQEMWNRPLIMRQAFPRKGFHYPQLTSQELNDLLIYLENLPETRGRVPNFRLGPAEAGRLIAETKGCAGCHQGGLSLEKLGGRFTIAGVAAAMWNHAAARRPPLSYEEMCGLVGYLWSLERVGEPRRGRSVLNRKECTGCHGGVLATSARETAALSVIATLWNRGPAMQAEMNRKGLAWRNVTGSEMADLTAYLVTRPSPEH